MKDQVTPKATARHLPLYYRYLRMLHNIEKSRTLSAELNEAVQVDSATIRRDLSYFGELDKRGHDYDVESPVNFFAETLGEDKLTSVALVGVGSLGSALLKYKFHQNNSVRVGYTFGVNEGIIGYIVDGIPVYPMEDMMKQVRVQQVGVAILTIPARKAQGAMNRLAKTRVKRILNFTAVCLVAPPEVLTQNTNLTDELQTLIYFLHHDNELIDEEE